MAPPRLNDLYRKYGPAIYSMTLRMLRDRPACEDATQEVFIKALPYLDRGLKDEEAYRLLYRIGTYYCLDILRRRKWEVGDIILNEDSSSPETRIVAKDLLVNIFGQCPDKLRAPAWLYFGEGMTQDKIAQVLEISRRTVVQRLQDFSAWIERHQSRQEVA